MPNRSAVSLVSRRIASSRLQRCRSRIQYDEEERRLARVEDLAHVGAGVGQAEGDQRVVEHLLDGVEPLVEERVAAAPASPSVSSSSSM